MYSGHEKNYVWLSRFPVGQVTFHSHLINRQVICQLNKKGKLRFAQGKQNLIAAYPKGKVEFKFLKALSIEIQQPTTFTLAKHHLNNSEMNPTTDREQFTRSNAPTARLPTLVRLAETLTRD